MAYSLLPFCKPHFHANDGGPAVGYKLYSFDSSTSEPSSLFANPDGSGAYGEYVELNSRGEPEGMGLYGDEALSYTLVFRTAEGADVWTMTGVVAQGGGGGGATVTMDTITQGTNYKKITTIQYNYLTSGGSTTLHYHSADRAWATLTGKPTVFAPSTHASTHNSGGSDALAHNNLNPSIAGTGVTYGHINDTTQTLAGEKTFSAGNTVFGSVANGVNGLVVLGADPTNMRAGLQSGPTTSDVTARCGSNHASVQANATGSGINLNSYNQSQITIASTSSGSQIELLGGPNGDPGAKAYQLLQLANDENASIILTPNSGSLAQTHDAAIKLQADGTSSGFAMSGIIYDDKALYMRASDGIDPHMEDEFNGTSYFFPETVSANYNIATREWVTANPATGGYNHTQSYPANVWTITHELGYRPVVQSWNSSDDVINGTIHHVSVDQLTITFSSGQGGGARCV